MPDGESKNEGPEVEATGDTPEQAVPLPESDEVAPDVDDASEQPESDVDDGDTSEPTEGDHSANTDRAAETFFGLTDRESGGVRYDDDYVDDTLYRIGRRRPGMELFLVLSFMVAGLVIAWWFRTDALYFFADDDPVEMGAAEDLPIRLETDPDILNAIPSNVLVHLAGVPRLASVTDDDQYFLLVGAFIFVEADDETYTARRQAPRGPFEEPLGRQYLEVTGRFLHFEDLSLRYRGLVQFYRKEHGVWFCGEELTDEQQNFRRVTRLNIERSLQEELGRAPRAEEIEAELEEQHHCVDAYLVQADVLPGKHSKYLIIMGIIALIELAGVWYTTRFVKLWRESRT